MDSAKPILVSVVVPVYNERDNIDNFFQRVVPLLESLSPKYDYEIVVTDNCSTDGTFERVREIAAANSRVVAFRFSRNFGYQKSILTGMMKASGAAVVQLDCDLQDPPELIPEFLQHWQEGNHVVYGIRRRRQEGFLITGTRKLFYKLLHAISDDKPPTDVGDFRLIDRQVVEQLRFIEDDHPYLRGTIASLGFRQLGVPYSRTARKKGESKFLLRDLFALARDGILNHSQIPLRLATYTGLLLSVLSMMVMLGYIVTKLFFKADWPSGFATLIIVNLFALGMISVFLGIIGEYVGRIHQQLKRRPITIIEQSINASQHRPGNRPAVDSECNSEPKHSSQHPSEAA